MTPNEAGPSADPNDPRISTGIEGLDEVLHGGLVPERTYTVRGGPGSGKTILGLQFLQEALQQGGTSLLINLEEPEGQIRKNAASLGLDLEGVHFLDLSPGSEGFRSEGTYDVFAPDEVEGPELSDRIQQTIEEIQPDRVFLDPVVELRQLSHDAHLFRNRVLAFKRLIMEQGATLLLSSQDEPGEDLGVLDYLVDGVIHLRVGPRGRRLGVPKFRGSSLEDGEHGVRILEGGIRVYPRIRPGEVEREFTGEQISSGIPDVDELLHGGLERGTVTVVSGPTGTGKTTLGTQFMKEAASRGDASSIFLFEESRATFLARSEGVSIPVEHMEERGTLRIHEIEALLHSPEEIGRMVRRDVEDHGSRIVMIDGVKGYQVSVGGDVHELAQRLHALCRWLVNRGVTVLLIDEVRDLTGWSAATEVGVSYLADNLLNLRHVDAQGEMRKVIGVIKKRTSGFEPRFLEFHITPDGIQVGRPWTGQRTSADVRGHGREGPQDGGA